MIFWKKELLELERSDRRFENIYGIMTSCLGDEIFSEQYKNGRNEKLSYRELFDMIDRIAASLQRLYSGCEGRFVSLRMSNSPLYIAALFACLKAGFSPVLINTRLDEASIEGVVRETDSLFVLTDEKPVGEKYMLVDTLLDGSGFEPVEWSNEIALLTSGTTGKPKIIIYDGSAISAQLLLSRGIIESCPSIKGGRKLVVRHIAFLPFYHIFGLMATFMWFAFFGRTFIFLPKYDSEGIRFACKYNKATHFFAIPMVWDTIVDTLFAQASKQGQLEKLQKGIALSNRLQAVFPRFGRWFARNVLFSGVREQMLGGTVKFCISGGGFISRTTLSVMNGLGYTLRNGYGMTETGILSVELGQSSKKLCRTSVGRPFVSVETKIENDILFVRGKMMYSCELVDGKRVFFDRDGYFNTNDMAEISRDKRLTLLGRRDDMIIGQNGENVNPVLIERMLYANGALFCVIGYKDKGEHERPVLVLEAPDGLNGFATATALKELYELMDGIIPSMLPAAVFVTEDRLPVNLGKIKRGELKSMIASGQIKLTAATRPSDTDIDAAFDNTRAETLERVRSIVAETFSVKLSSVNADTNVIFELGADSFKFYNLLSALSEEFEVELSMNGDRAIFTPADFTAEILRIKDDR